MSLVMKLWRDDKREKGYSVWRLGRKGNPAGKFPEDSVLKRLFRRECGAGRLSVLERYDTCLLLEMPVGIRQQARERFLKSVERAA